MSILTSGDRKGRLNRSYLAGQRSRACFVQRIKLIFHLLHTLLHQGLHVHIAGGFAHQGGEFFAQAFAGFGVFQGASFGGVLGGGDDGGEFGVAEVFFAVQAEQVPALVLDGEVLAQYVLNGCLLYTSDAADE